MPLSCFRTTTKQGKNRLYQVCQFYIVLKILKFTTLNHDGWRPKQLYHSPSQLDREEKI